MWELMLFEDLVALNRPDIDRVVCQTSTICNFCWCLCCSGNLEKTLSFAALPCKNQVVWWFPRGWLSGKQTGSLVVGFKQNPDPGSWLGLEVMAFLSAIIDPIKDSLWIFIWAPSEWSQAQKMMMCSTADKRLRSRREVNGQANRSNMPQKCQLRLVASCISFASPAYGRIASFDGACTMDLGSRGAVASK